MKTILKNDVYERQDDKTADLKARSQGWKFVPKSEWKEKVRDADSETRAERKAKKAK